MGIRDSFKYATSQDMGKLFDLEANGYFYSRLQNQMCIRDSLHTDRTG